jgi:dTDP-glucose 4,6-dehydratase
VLVTGAGGFIGSHLVEALGRREAHVRALVRYNSQGRQGWLDDLSETLRHEIEVFAGDVSEYGSLRRAVEGVDIVFHLAALIGVPYSYASPAAYVRTNVEGTLNALEAARDAGVERFVHTSTSEVYGTARYVPIDEAHPLQAQSPYAATKIGADALAHSFERSFGLPVAIARPFNTYGPRQSYRAVIPTIISQALDGQLVRLGATRTTRDFTFILDTVSGLIAVAESTDAVGNVVNIGSGVETSIEDLVGLIAALMERDLKVVLDPDRLRPPGSEVERLRASIDKAQRLLDWRPSFTLRQGLQRTIAWFQDHPQAFAVEPSTYAI